jgi:hypothetical protein
MGPMAGLLWLVTGMCFLSSGVQFAHYHFKNRVSDPYPFSMKAALAGGVLLGIAAVVTMLGG